MNDTKEYTKEITGERLTKFMTIVNHDNKYLTEDELCQKYALDRVQLYNFLKIRGRLNDDGSHKQKNFKPNGNLEFGPLVKINNKISYLNPYWSMCFEDIKYKALLQECQKNSVKVLPKTNKTKTKAKINDRHKLVYIQTLAVVKGDKLYALDRKDRTKISRLIDNEGKDTTLNGTSYNIINLKRALKEGTDYRSRYGKNDLPTSVVTTPVMKNDTENLDIILKTSGHDTYSDESLTLLKLKAFDLAIRAHATNPNKTVEQYYAWIRSELSK
jgi:hypothetical protein